MDESPPKINPLMDGSWLNQPVGRCFSLPKKCFVTAGGYDEQELFQSAGCLTRLRGDHGLRQRGRRPAGNEGFGPGPRVLLQREPGAHPQEAKDAFYHYRLEARGIDVYVEAVPAGTEEEGVGESLRSAGVDPASLVLDGSAAFGDWRARRLIDRGRERAVAVAYQMRGGVVYSLIAAASASAMPGDPPGSVMGISGASGSPKPGAPPLRPPPGGPGGARARCGRERGREHIPRGIRDGRIIYRYSAGMARRGEPGSPETAYHWGSMTKVVTAVAVVQLEERGSWDWILP